MLADYFVALLLLPSAVQGQVSPTLEVTPHTCIQESKATKCMMDVQVTASAPNQQTLCVTIELPALKPKCFEGSQLSTHFKVVLETTVNIALTNEVGDVLVQKKLSVGKLTSKNYRVRRRFGWGI